MGGIFAQRQLKKNEEKECFDIHVAPDGTL